MAAPTTPKRTRLKAPFNGRIEGNLHRVIFVTGQQLRFECFLSHSDLFPLPLGDGEISHSGFVVLFRGRFTAGFAGDGVGSGVGAGGGGAGMSALANRGNKSSRIAS